MTVRVATVPVRPEDESHLAEMIEADPRFTLFMRCVDRVETLAVIQAGVEVVLFVGWAPWLDDEVLREARAGRVRLLGHAGDPLEVEEFQRVGISVIQGEADGATLLNLCTQPDESDPADPVEAAPSEGDLVAVWGPKGAPGRTTLAIELAHSFAMREPSTVLVDADPSGGDITQYLGILGSPPNVVALARAAARGSTDRLLPQLVRCGPRGPVLIPGMARSSSWRDVSAHGWRSLLTLLRHMFKVVVVDVGPTMAEPDPLVPHDRDEMTRIALQMADRVVAICRGDPIGIKVFVHGLEELERLVDTEAISVVLNKARWQERELRAILRDLTGRRVMASLPEDPNSVTRCLADGKALLEGASGTPLVTAIEAMAASMGAAIRPRGFLTRLAGGR